MGTSYVEQGDRAKQVLESLLEDAVADGADSIDLEYVSDGLEVTFMFGNSGIGSVVDDRILAGELIRLIVERAKLQNRSRGMINWTYHGKSHNITVVEYENFNESAFRLILDDSRGYLLNM